MELDQRIDALSKSVTDLASELKTKRDMPLDRVNAIEAELTAQSTQLDELVAQKKASDLLDRLADQEKAIDELRSSSKARAILAGVPRETSEDETFAFGGYLKAMMGARQGDYDAAQALKSFKATLATSASTGQSIIPNNFVNQIVEIATATNPYRGLMNVITGVRGKAVDLPYEANDSSIQRAQLQGGEAGSFGSNKDSRDFTVNSSTATLYTLARIVDVGNQFLRQSEGAAERLVVSKLGRAFGLGEAYYIINGSGTNQPMGLKNGTGLLTYALSSESRMSALGNGIAKLEAQSQKATAITIHPTDFWELATETLGSSGSGGWALAPAAGGSTFGGGQLTVWGVPLVRDPNLTVGTAYVANFAAIDLFFGQDYTIDVSNEANTRWDLNVTGFRAEEEMAFHATPYTATNHVCTVTGL